jgi:alpha-galactosidase
LRAHISRRAEEMIALLLQFAAVNAIVKKALGIDNGLARLPPMAYNSWNDLNCDNLTGDALISTAVAMKKAGLLQLGYAYINADDCWQVRSRLCVCV